MRTSGLAALLFVSSQVLAASEALAGPDLSDQTKDATVLFEEGRKLMRAKDYEHARIKFLEVRAVSKSSNNLWNLAVCEVESRHFVEATHDLREYLHRPDADPSLFPEANAYLSRTLPYIGQIQITLPGASAKVDGDAEYGASALVDPIAVTPGHHRVEADAGRQHIAKEIDVSAGTTVTVSPPEPPIDHPGPPASRPTTAAPPTEPPDGSGEPQPAQPGTFTTGRKVALGVGIAGVALAGVGVGFAVSANDAINNAAGLRSTNSSSSCTGSPSSERCASIQSAVSTANSNAPVATGLFIGGGVLAAGAILIWLVTPPHPPRSGWLLVPSFDHTGAGLRLACDF